MANDDTVGDAAAIRHFERTGVILPGHGDTIARYRAEGTNA